MSRQEEKVVYKSYVNGKIFETTVIYIKDDRYKFPRVNSYYTKNTFQKKEDA